MPDFKVGRRHIGDRLYQEGEIRTLSAAEAAPLLASGTLTEGSADGRKAERPMQNKAEPRLDDTERNPRTLRDRAERLSPMSDAGVARTAPNGDSLNGTEAITTGRAGEPAATALTPDVGRSAPATRGRKAAGPGPTSTPATAPAPAAVPDAGGAADVSGATGEGTGGAPADASAPSGDGAA